MEALVQLERERGNPADGTAKGGVETVDGKKGKQGRVASNEMCTFLILNISSRQLIPVIMIAYIYLFTICCCMALKLHGTILQ